MENEKKLTAEEKERKQKIIDTWLKEKASDRAFNYIFELVIRL